jgi:hypothetical protein
MMFTKIHLVVCVQGCVGLRVSPGSLGLLYQSQGERPQVPMKKCLNFHML